MTEIECVAEAMRLRSIERGFPIHPVTVHHIAAAAIEALDNFRSAEKRRTCKHFNRTGTGSIGSDGSGWSTWFCQECGASYDSRESTVVPRPDQLPHGVSNHDE